MTVAQRERYIREVSVLRLAGAAFVIKLWCEDAFYLRFLSHMSSFLVAHLYADGPGENAHEVSGAMEAYIAAMEAQSPEEMSKLYMRRVYDDSDHYLRLSASGVGFLSVDWLMDSYEIFRDAYFKVVAGMPYESWKLLHDAMEKAKREVPDA